MPPPFTAVTKWLSYVSNANVFADSSTQTNVNVSKRPAVVAPVQRATPCGADFGISESSTVHCGQQVAILSLSQNW